MSETIKQHDCTEYAKINCNCPQGFCKYKGIEISRAVQTLVAHLKSDPEFHNGWKDNIAVAIQNSYKDLYPITSRSGVVDIKVLSNNAAERFLFNLINAE